jgi:hypothetical protein
LPGGRNPALGQSALIHPAGTRRKGNTSAYGPSPSMTASSRSSSKRRARDIFPHGKLSYAGAIPAL